MSEATHWQGHRGPLLDRVDGFSVIDCEPCGFRHLTPIPTAEDLHEVYRHEYYSTEKPRYLERAGEDLAWWNHCYAERYQLLEELLPSARRRLLEVGSGPGHFCLLGKQRGWEVLGIEPSRQAAQHARELGVPVVEEFLESELAAKLGPFDAIHVSEVLEHLPDPGEQLRLCREMLAPGGLICVTVPNDYNPFQETLREARGFQPWWVGPPHHVNYFDFASIAGLLERTGFEVLQQEATFPIDLFLLMGDDYVGDDAVGRSCHKKRMAFEASLHGSGRSELLRALYRKLAELGLGRVAVTMVRKP